jgi:hypothetical protein
VCKQTMASTQLAINAHMHALVGCLNGCVPAPHQWEPCAATRSQSAYTNALQMLLRCSTTASTLLQAEIFAMRRL